MIDPTVFAFAHEAFLAEIEAHDPEHRPFEGFDHSYFAESETGYKRRIYHEARRTLQRSTWDQALSEPGRITHLVAEATLCCGNLLERRYGDNNSAKALYTTRREGTVEQKRTMDAHLVRLFDGPMAPEAFGPRVDAFADYLRAERLGCPWDFIAYLAFIADDEQRYVPIKSTAIQYALQYYGDDSPLAGRVEWHRYMAVLRLLDDLAALLEPLYGSVSRLDIQGYLWLVTEYALPAAQGKRSTPKKNKTWKQEIARREALARQRERIGLRGERYCLESERQRLLSAGRPDLADRVELVSITGSDSGYDLLTFEVEGAELHVEVKSTILAPDSKRGFWLSESERARAARDEAWRLWRVWRAESDPEIEDLGNLVQAPRPAWQLEPSAWKYTPS